MKKRKRNVLMSLLIFAIFGLVLWMSSYFHRPEFPDFVIKTPRIQDAYLFAESNREVTNAVPCFCGCMGSLGHQSVYDCFVNSNEDYDPHGADCQMCIDIALDTKSLLNQGYSKEEIAAFITKKYGG